MAAQKGGKAPMRFPFGSKVPVRWWETNERDSARSKVTIDVSDDLAADDVQIKLYLLNDTVF